MTTNPAGEPPPVPIGILIVSDRASAGVYEDRAAPAIRAFLRQALTSPWIEERRLVPDEREIISQAIVELSDVKGCPLILVMGGTGPAPRDVTPEAVEDVCHKVLPGFGEAMRAASLLEVPTAVLSRQLAAIRGKSLVITLPGKPSSVVTCLGEVFRAVPYCIDLIGGPRLETNPRVYPAFRPRA